MNRSREGAPPPTPTARSAAEAPATAEAAAIAPAPLRSPEILADGRVVFRCHAPRAGAVALHREDAEPAPMTRDARGVWSITVGPLAPDLYGYVFVVDGAGALDASNPVLQPNLLGPRSMVHVPGRDPSPWDETDVPHGVLHRHAYRSSLVGDRRELHVYTPPDHVAGDRRTYPVLYLLHGFSDDATAWTAVGRAHAILDGLIALGKAAPMIVAMPLGYGAPEILQGGFAGFWRDAELRRRNLSRFVEALLGEVIPLVEAAYPARVDRDARAIAGLSMGGAEALLAGLNHPDRFGWVGAFSAGGLGDDFAAELPGARPDAAPRLLWVSCGAQDPLAGVNRRLRAWLHARGLERVEPEGGEVPGGHAWTVWRRDLAAFAARIFRGE